MNNSQKIIEGLVILARFPDNCIGVGHDVIYSGPENSDSVRPEDRARLEELGWFFDEDVDSWCYFV